jgi:hypothetical protein
MKSSFIYVQFSDGKQYRIPAEFIAKDRAMYYAEIEWALGNRHELLDWMSNNMKWKDVCEVAEFVKNARPPADPSVEWVNANKWLSFMENEVDVS